MDVSSFELRGQPGEPPAQPPQSEPKSLTSQEQRDEATIARFGKRQQLSRRFKSLSSIGLTSGLMLTWEVVLFLLTIGLSNGGPGGLVYGFLAAWLGATLQSLVLAEMASMIPLAGGPFNWVAILAPQRWRKFLSYLAGWLTVIAWQAFVAEVCYTCALLIQNLAIVNCPTYVPQQWHGTLLFFAVIGFGLFTNTVLGRLLPQIESLMLVFYVLGFFGVLIPLVYLSPKKPASEVFGTFQNLGEWNSMGLSFFVGWITSVSSFIGNDAADHIAEEIQDAERVIPFSMWFSTVFNGVLGFAMMLAVLFCMGDITTEAYYETTFPFMPIFNFALGSTSGGAALSIVITAVNVFSVSSVIATASRMLWAFSRDNGVPFSKFIVKIRPKSRIPVNAIAVTVMINVLLALISIGSSTAFQAFYSVVVVAYFSSFLLASSIMLHKRLTLPHSEIPWGPFRLGRAGVPVTVVAMSYTVMALFFSLWPSAPSPTAAEMNYSIVIYGGAIIFALIFWAFWGRKVYKGPIWEFHDGDIRAN